MTRSAPLTIILTAFGTSLMLTVVAAIPNEQAAAVIMEDPAQQIEREIQTLTTEDYDIPSIPLEAPEAEISEEWLKAQEEAKRKAEAEKAAAEAAEAAQLNSAEPRVYKDVPPGKGAEGLVNAAKAQLGVHQDCTDLVQNSLAAIGLTQRRDQGGFDLGTGIWQYDGFGTRVDINSLAPGDILIYGNAGSGAHVSIYIGNGQAVHGGWSGLNTAIAGADQAWQPITGAIRVS